MIYCSERRIELMAENSMSFDYWRNKKSVVNPYVGEIKYNDYRTILPIPQARDRLSSFYFDSESAILIR